MPTEAIGRFQQIRNRRMQSPAFRQRYTRTRRTIASVEEIIGSIDARRQTAGVSKAELARRAGMNPAALRRLLTSGAGNPTLSTVIGLMDALGMRLQVVVLHAPSSAHRDDLESVKPAPARHTIVATARQRS